jgi:hypothetical protein
MENVNQPEKPIETEKKQPDWVEDLGRRSYELEMLISGVGIYLTAELPNWIEWAYDYYFHNFLLNIDSVAIAFPLLIYAFLKTVAYLLSFTLIFHFILRAFWVGLVGLLSVFPEGIRYDNIPKSTPELIAKLKGKIGNATDWIVALDNLSSIIFSAAFSFVLIMVGICCMYSALVILMSCLALLIPIDIFNRYELTIYFGLLAMIILPSLWMGLLSLPYFRRNPRWAKHQADLVWAYNSRIFPFIGQPMTFLSLFFRSNLSAGRFGKYLAVTIVLCFGMFFFIFIDKVQGDILEARRTFSSGAEMYEILEDRYENQRTAGKIIKNITIQSEVIKEDYIRLFISYPAFLDNKLTKCPPLKLSDTLSRDERLQRTDTYRLACWQRALTIRLNDSICRKVELVFYTHPNAGERGFLAYIPLTHCPKGRNILQISNLYGRTPRTAERQKNAKKWLSVPFQYLPQKDD